MGQKIIKLKDNEPFITLQSVLKITGLVATGGMVKAFLADNVVFVNGERENRRGRKLYSGDEIQLLNEVFVIK